MRFHLTMQIRIYTLEESARGLDCLDTCSCIIFNHSHCILSSNLMQWMWFKYFILTPITALPADRFIQTKLVGRCLVNSPTSRNWNTCEFLVELCTHIQFSKRAASRSAIPMIYASPAEHRNILKHIPDYRDVTWECAGISITTCWQGRFQVN